VIWLVACAVPEVEGTWLAGDLHVHSSVASNDTDGLGTPDALAAAMEVAGLDFVYVTDHSNSAGSMHCEDVEDCPNLGPELPVADWPDGVWLGSEISPRHPQDSEATGHVGCLPLDGASFPGLEAFVDRPMGEVTGGEALAQCLDHGGFGIVNHPFGVPWLRWDETSEDFDAIEVYNGTARFEQGDEQAVAWWEELVVEREVVAVGGSDCHRWGLTDPDSLLDPPLGWPTTWVLVRDGERPLDAIRAGRVVVAEPGATIALEARRGRRLAVPGERIRGPAVLTASGASEGTELELVQVGVGVVASGAPITVEVGPGVYYARLWPDEIGLMTPGVALTNPIRVE
jgi:hypothetical protein